MSAHEPTLSVVLIGPMAEDVTDAAQSPLSTHLPNITGAIENLNREYERRNEALRLIPISAHDIQAGEIDTFAFLSIDQADLAIADISARSPNVFYELAILNALGRPTLIIDEKSSAKEPPFYLKGQKIIGVESFSVEHLTTVLRDAFETHVVNGELASIRSSPIERFYNNALVDASATGGIANGYFFNGIRRIIEKETGILARIRRQNNWVNAHLNRLAIVRPANIHSLDEENARLNDIRGFKRDREYKAEDFTRPFKFASAANYIIDYPTPLQSISISPSYKKLRDLIMRFPRRDFAYLEKFEQRMIDSFFATLQKLANETDRCNADLMEVMSLDALVERIERPFGTA